MRLCFFKTEMLYGSDAASVHTETNPNDFYDVLIFPLEVHVCGFKRNASVESIKPSHFLCIFLLPLCAYI